MLGFFLILLIVFVLWPILRTALAMYKFRRQARDFFNSATGNARGRGARPMREERKPGWSKPASKEKVYRPVDGEYVEWEEVSVTESQTTYSTTTDAEGNTRVRVESQVTDVEWEEVNISD